MPKTQREVHYEIVHMGQEDCQQTIEDEKKDKSRIAQRLAQIARNILSVLSSHSNDDCVQVHCGVMDLGNLDMYYGDESGKHPWPDQNRQIVLGGALYENDDDKPFFDKSHLCVNLRKSAWEKKGYKVKVDEDIVIYENWRLYQ